MYQGKFKAKINFKYRLFICLLLVLFLPFSAQASLSDAKISKNENDDIVNFVVIVPSNSKDPILTSITTSLKDVGFVSDNMISSANYSSSKNVTSLGRKKVTTYYHSYSFSLDKTKVGNFNGDLYWTISITDNTGTYEKVVGSSVFVKKDLTPPTINIKNKKGENVQNLGTLNYPITPENIVVINVEDDADQSPKVYASLKGSNGTSSELILKKENDSSYILQGFSFVTDGTSYEVDVKALDQAGNESNKSFIFKVARDDDAPVINFWDNNGNSITNLGNVSYPVNVSDLFSVVVADNRDPNPQIIGKIFKVGAKKEEVNLSCSGTGTIKCKINKLDEKLTEGNYQISITSVDSFNNQSISNLSFNYQGDTTPPKIKVLDRSLQEISSENLMLKTNESIKKNYFFEIKDSQDSNPLISILLNNSTLAFNCIDGRCSLNTEVCSENLKSNQEVVTIEGSNYLKSLPNIISVTASDHLGNTSQKSINLFCITPISSPEIIVYKRDVEQNSQVPFEVSEKINFGLISWPLKPSDVLRFKVKAGTDPNPKISITFDNEKVVYTCGEDSCAILFPENIKDKTLLDVDINVIDRYSQKNETKILFSCDCTDLPPEIFFVDTSDVVVSGQLELVDPNRPENTIFIKATDDRDVIPKVSLKLWGGKCNFGCDVDLSANGNIFSIANNSLDLEHGKSYTLSATSIDSSNHITTKDLSFIFYKDKTSPVLSYCPNGKKIGEGGDVISSLGSFRFEVTDNKTITPRILAEISDLTTSVKEELEIYYDEKGCFGLQSPKKICFRNNSSCQLRLTSQDDYKNTTIRNITLNSKVNIIDLNTVTLPLIDHNVIDPILGHTLDLTSYFSSNGISLTTGTKIYAYLEDINAKNILVNDKEVSFDNAVYLGEIKSIEIDYGKGKDTSKANNDELVLDQNSNTKAISLLNSNFNSNSHSNLNSNLYPTSISELEASNVGYGIKKFFLDIAPGNNWLRNNDNIGSRNDDSENEINNVGGRVNLILFTSSDNTMFRLKINFFTPKLILKGPTEALRLIQEKSINASTLDNSCALTMNYSEALDASPQNHLCLLRFLQVPHLFYQQENSNSLFGRFNEKGEVIIKAAIYWVDSLGEYKLSETTQTVKVVDSNDELFSLVKPNEPIYAGIKKYDFKIKGNSYICELIYQENEFSNLDEKYSYSSTSNSLSSSLLSSSSSLSKEKSFSSSSNTSDLDQLSKCLVRWKNIPDNISFDEHDKGVSVTFLNSGNFEFGWAIYAFGSDGNEVLIFEHVDSIEVLLPPHPKVIFTPSNDVTISENCNVNDSNGDIDSDESTSSNYIYKVCEVYVPLSFDNKFSKIGTLIITAPSENVKVLHNGVASIVNLKNGIAEVPVYENNLNVKLFDIKEEIYKVGYSDSVNLTDLSSNSLSNSSSISSSNLSSSSSYLFPSFLSSDVTQMNLKVINVPTSELNVYLNIPDKSISMDNIVAEVYVDKAVKGFCNNNNLCGTWDYELVAIIEDEIKVENELKIENIQNKVIQSTNNEINLEKIESGSYQIISTVAKKEFATESVSELESKSKIETEVESEFASKLVTGSASEISSDKNKASELIVGSKRESTDDGKAIFHINLNELIKKFKVSGNNIQFKARAYLRSSYPNYQKNLISDATSVKILSINSTDTKIITNRVEGFAPLQLILSLDFPDSTVRKAVSAITWQIRRCKGTTLTCLSFESNKNDEDNIKKADYDFEEDWKTFGSWESMTESKKSYTLTRRLDYGIYQVRALIYDENGELSNISSLVNIKVYRRTQIELEGPTEVCVDQDAIFYPKASFKDENLVGFKNTSLLNLSSQEQNSSDKNFVDNNNTVDEGLEISNDLGDTSSYDINKIDVDNNVSVDDSVILEESYDNGLSWNSILGNSTTLVSQLPGVKTLLFRSYDPWAGSDPEGAVTLKKATVYFRKPSLPTVSLTGPAYLEPKKESMITAKVSSRCLNDITGYFETSQGKFSGNVLKFIPTSEDIKKGQTKICYFVLDSKGENKGKSCQRFKVHSYFLPEFRLRVKNHLSYAPENVVVDVIPKQYSLSALIEKSPLKFYWSVKSVNKNENFENQKNNEIQENFENENVRENEGINKDFLDLTEISNLSDPNNDSYGNCSLLESACTISVNKAGDYKVQVIITDRYGRSRVASSSFTLNEAPKLDVKLNIKSTSSYIRAPFDVSLSYRITGGHPRDSVSEVNYFLNNQKLEGNKIVLSEGLQDLKVEIKTSMGYSSSYNMVVNVLPNKVPVCKLIEEDDEINYRYKAICSDSDGRVKNYRWYIDGTLSKSNAWQIAVLKKSRKSSNKPLIILEAIDEVGGVSDPVHSSEVN